MAVNECIEYKDNIMQGIVIDNAELKKLILENPKDDLECDIREALDDIHEGLNDEEFDNLVAIKMKTLEPYWKECIEIIVDRF